MKEILICDLIGTLSSSKIAVDKDLELVQDEFEDFQSFTRIKG